MEYTGYLRSNRKEFGNKKLNFNMKIYTNNTIGASMDFAVKRIYFYDGILSQWASTPFKNNEGVGSSSR